ncbi:uncharacterized protein LOC126980070 [Leptidea sinapis]|uniref:uncharacterized protein LOC126980070 n=1 Tax=Leptidea sinapis TaxID=189913 RepID=UPI0021C34083|nr:uncharacterized protein LOC126980070 [Leptidea sinapis]
MQVCLYIHKLFFIVFTYQISTKVNAIRHNRSKQNHKNKVLRDKIRSFLDFTNHATSVQFIEMSRPPEDDTARWAFFINRQGLLSCDDHPFHSFSSVGVQKIVLGYDCFITTSVLADIVLSLIGVPPQHNAPNRDDYIVVNKENILPEKLHLFEKLKDDEWLFYDIDYDFNSAGHFGPHKHTTNGFSTIAPKIENFKIRIGDSKGFSLYDIIKINLLYNYISKYKGDEKKTLSKCDKLFEPGEMLNHVKLAVEIKNPKPRKKPSKYLVLPVENDNENKNDKNINESSEESDNQDTNLMIVPLHGRQIHPLKVKSKMELLELSDYGSDDSKFDPKKFRGVG